MSVSPCLKCNTWVTLYQKYCPECVKKYGLVQDVNYWDPKKSLNDADPTRLTQRENEITIDQWKAAKTHLDDMDKAYLDLSGMPGVNVQFVRRVVIAPLQDQYDNGERTPELYQAMLAVE